MKFSAFAFRAASHTSSFVKISAAQGDVLVNRTVIKHFDVIANIAAYFFSCSVNLFLYPFTLEYLEKAFRNCVVVTVITTAHTALQSV